MDRRSMMALGLAVFGAATPARAADSPQPPAKRAPSGDLAGALFGGDEQFWFETVRMFGAADYGGAEFGEVMAASIQITPGDYDSWHAAWHGLAERISAEAAAALAKGHKLSARDGFLRASNYYRSSEFFLHGTPRDPRIAVAYKRSVACFQGAAALFKPQITPVEIPYEHTTLPGYFYSPDGSGRPRPTVILNTGFDGSAEEMHFQGAQAGVERGYNVLSFDGPGQFGPLHREGLVFRPDWEKVVTPVVDFLARRSDVDQKRIAMWGCSMGGELAPRAAAFEKRIAACIANDGLYDNAAPILANAPAFYRETLKARFRAPQDTELDAMLAKGMQTNPTQRWAMTHGMYALGVKTPRAYCAALLDYNLGGGVAEQISCPTLVCDAQNDLFFKGQAQILYDHLKCPKTMIKFTTAEGAGSHCQVEASRLSNARIYDWLDETFGVNS